MAFGAPLRNHGYAEVISDPVQLDRLLAATVEQDCLHVALVYLSGSRGMACATCLRWWARITNRRLGGRKYMVLQPGRVCGECYWPPDGTWGCSCEQKAWREANPNGARSFD